MYFERGLGGPNIATREAIDPKILEAARGIRLLGSQLLIGADAEPFDEHTAARQEVNALAAAGLAASIKATMEGLSVEQAAQFQIATGGTLSAIMQVGVEPVQFVSRDDLPALEGYQTPDTQNFRQAAA